VPPAKPDAAPAVGAEDPLRKGLALHLDFEGDFVTTGLAKDVSGAGNDGLSSVERKQVPTVTPGIVGKQAAEFLGEYPDMPANDGDYMAVKKSDSLCNLKTGTVALWARYNGNQEPHYTSATLLMTWRKLGEDSRKMPYGAPGTWYLGRSYTDYNAFAVFDKDGNRACDNHGILKFPDEPAWRAAIAGRSQWHHYAVTWDGGEFRGYYDGNQFGAFSQANIPFLTIGIYLCVGANSHSSEPENNANYRYPNHGFINGSVDDIRIYNRALSAEEVRGLNALATGPREIAVTPSTAPAKRPEPSTRPASTRAASSRRARAVAAASQPASRPMDW
jgi:hypothetical protein